MVSRIEEKEVHQQSPAEDTAAIDINVVEAHCCALQCRQIDCEQICTRINQQLIARDFDVLYAADKGLCGQNVLQSIVD